MRSRPAPLLLAAAAAAAAAACADVPTGSEPFSLTFDRLPFPAVAVGDTLRDTTGAAAPLAARVFDAAGNVLADVPVSYLLLDRGATLLEGGYVRGDSAGPTVRVVAEASGIPSLPLDLRVVLPPDSLALLTTAPDTARYTRGGFSAADTTGRIEVRLLHRPAAAAPVGVQHWMVRYDVEAFDGATPIRDASLAAMVDERSRLSALDTTDAQGGAWRRVLLNGTHAAIDAVDSVVVSVTVLGRPAGAVTPATVRVAVPVRSR